MAGVTTARTPRRTTAAPPPARRRPRAVRARAAAGSTGYHLISAVLALVFLFPILYAVLSSFKTPDEANASPPTLLPRSLSLANYAGLTDYGAGIVTYLANSVAVSVMAVVLSVVVCVLAGYGFARFEFAGKQALFATTLGILMVPYATILLPLYIVLGRVGLQNSLLGLALVLVMFQLPFGVFMMRNSFASVPPELEQAAMVDGCTSMGALRHVALPIVSPGIVTVALFAFLASWNEFLAPLIFLSDSDRYTLPIMLVNIRSGAYGSVDVGALQAGVVVAMVPCLVLYLLLQRFYVSGLVNGALRG